MQRRDLQHVPGPDAGGPPQALVAVAEGDVDESDVSISAPPPGSGRPGSVRRTRCPLPRRRTRRRPAAPGARDGGRHAVDPHQRQRGPRPGQGLGPVDAVHDQLGQQGVVERGDDAAALHVGVDADARRRPAARRGAIRPGDGRKPCTASSALIRHSTACPVRTTSSCRIRSGCPSATASCSATRSRPVTSLGDRVLDLDAGVHLQEVEGVPLAVDQELDRAQPAVAQVRGQPQRRRRPSPPAARSDSSGAGASSISFW